MNVKKKARRVMSGLLTAVTVLSTVLSPAVAYASDDAGSVKKIPYSGIFIRHRKSIRILPVMI